MVSRAIVSRAIAKPGAPQQRPPVFGRVVGHELAQVVGHALERLALEQRQHLRGRRLAQAALGVAVGEGVEIEHRRLDRSIDRWVEG